MRNQFVRELERADLASRLPIDEELRTIAVGLLAERYYVEDLVRDPIPIRDAVEEACEILEHRSV